MFKEAAASRKQWMCACIALACHYAQKQADSKICTLVCTLCVSCYVPAFTPLVSASLTIDKQKCITMDRLIACYYVIMEFLLPVVHKSWIAFACQLYYNNISSSYLFILLFSLLLLFSSLPPFQHIHTYIIHTHKYGDDIIP